MNRDMDAFKFTILKKIQFEQMETTRKKSLIFTFIASWLIFLPYIIKNMVIGAYWVTLILSVFLILLSIKLYTLFKDTPSFINPHLIVNILILAILSVIHQFGMSAMFWAFPICIVFLFVLPYRVSVVYNIMLWALVSAMAFNIASFPVAMRLFVALGATVLIAMYIQRVIWDLTRELVRQMNLDPLTGLYNRRYLNGFLESEYQRCVTTDRNAFMLMIDIDHFKRINDQYGHLEGDLILKKVADHLNRQIRGADLLFRVGGEEFLVVLQDMSKKQVIELSNRLIQSTKAKEWIVDQSITISIGLCDAASANSAMDWLSKSDRMLYQAKQDGRNQAILYQAEKKNTEQIA